MIGDSDTIYIDQFIEQWEDFIEHVKQNPTYRVITLEAWQCCNENNVDPDKPGYQILSKHELDIKRKNNDKLLRAAKPFIEDISISLLDIPHFIILAEKNAWGIELNGNFMQDINIGINYSDKYLGNNVINSSLKKGKPCLIYGTEHYIEGFKNFCCFGVPIHNNFCDVIGALNVTVPIQYASPQNLIIVLSSMKALEFKLGYKNDEVFLIDEITIGNNIRKIREAKALPQTFVAKKANISQSFLSDIENGKKSPTLRSIGLIANALNMSVKNLIS